MAGWAPRFMPEQADIFLEPLLRGLAKSGRTLADIDVQVGGSLEIDDDVERLIEARRPRYGLYLGRNGLGEDQLL